MRGDATDFGPIPGAAEEGPRRSRIGIARSALWSRRRIGLLVLGILVLPWLPIFDHRLESPPMHRVRGDSGVSIRRFALSSDGQSVATIDDEGRVRLRPAVDGGSILRALDVRGFGMAVAFSPDGRHLAIGRDEPDVVLIDLDGSGRERLLGIPVRRTMDLRFSPEGRILAVSSAESSAIILWDIDAGRPRMTLQGDLSPVAAMAFAPDGRSLASAYFAAFMIWDLNNGRPRYRLAGPRVLVPSLAYSPDGRLLAAVILGENSIRIWDARTGGPIRTIPGRSVVFQSLAFSPDGRLLATAEGDGFASLRSVTTGRDLRRLDGRAQYLREVAFSPDGRVLAATGDDGDIRLWDLFGPIKHPAGP
jgi:tricorn protease-like protein